MVILQSQFVDVLTYRPFNIDLRDASASKNDDENSIFVCIWNDMYVDFFLLQKKLNDRQVMALTSRGLMNSLLLPLVALGKG